MSTNEVVISRILSRKILARASVVWSRSLTDCKIMHKFKRSDMFPSMVFNAKCVNYNNVIKFISWGAAELKKKSGLVYAVQSNGPHPQVKEVNSLAPQADANTTIRRRVEDSSLCAANDSLIAESKHY